MRRPRLRARQRSPRTVVGLRCIGPGVARRFDSVWVSPHFRVINVDYPYEGCIEAGSDHSAVVVDLSFD